MALTYYDKQEAKVAIMWELQAKGWKVYGYKPDQSDSMTDYFNPASWKGIAEKNGYVLLVDICEYDLQYSGKQITKKTYTIDYNKLHRLESLMNDPASSENEKAVCRAKIEAMKQKEKENTVIIEQYPTFKHANPKKCSWHIEKDGEIIAKGTGVFSVYDSNEKEMQKKAAKFVERIEKAISDNSQLKVVQVEEVKKVVKPVEINIPLSQFEKDKTHIKLNATFTSGNYKGSLYVLKRTYVFRNSMRYEFVKLGKRLQPLSTYNGNNILVLDEKGLQKYLANGDIVTVEFKEVEEVTYKTVYKKTARKPQQSNLLTGETVEPTQQEQPQQMENTATKKQRYALYIASNRKIDTRNIIISKEKASELISRSMQGEDITSELQAIAEGKQTEEVTEQPEAQQETLTDVYNAHKEFIDLIATNRQFNDALRMTDLKPYVVNLQNAYYDVKENKKYSFVQPVDVHNAVNALQNSELFNILKSEYITGSEHDNTQQAEERKEAQESINQQENEQEVFSIIPKVQENTFDLQFFSGSINTDDILNLFDTIDLTQEKTIISDEDREHINKYEESYRATLSVFENHLQQLQELHGQYGDYYSAEEAFGFVCDMKDIRKIQERIKELKENFVYQICRYFMNKYNVTIDYKSIYNKYDTTVTAQNILDEIVEQLDGFTFVEKAQQEIKQQLQKEITKNTEVKDNKLILSNFFYLDQFDLKWGDYKLSYNSYDRAETLLKALYLYEYNITQLTEEAEQLLKTLKYSKNDDVFTTHELNLNKIKSIKLYKNGRVDIEFTSSHYAREFAKDFLNIVKAA